jgi:hypothetical protein
MPKFTLTPEQRAQILAGGSEIETGEAPPATGAATPPATPAASTTAPPAPPPPAPPATAGHEAVIAYQKTQIDEAATKLGAATAEIDRMKLAAADTAAHLPALVTIAQAVIGQMQVALGGTDTSAGLAAGAAVAEHARLLPLFTAKFPGGRISAASTEDPEEAPIREANTELARRLTLVKP